MLNRQKSAFADVCTAHVWLRCGAYVEGCEKRLQWSENLHKDIQHLRSCGGYQTLSPQMNLGDMHIKLLRSTGDEHPPNPLSKQITSNRVAMVHFVGMGFNPSALVGDGFHAMQSRGSNGSF